MPNQNNKKSWTEEQLIDAVTANHSYAGVLKELNLRPSGGNYANIKKYIKNLSLDISHFTGQGSNAGKTFSYRWVDVRDKLTKNSNWNTNSLRQQLIRAGIFEKKCYMCFNTTWLGEPIPLELDHIDGDRTNNMLDNLRILCPNCHATTPNYRGKNIK